MNIGDKVFVYQEMGFNIGEIPSVGEIDRETKLCFAVGANLYYKDSLALRGRGDYSSARIEAYDEEAWIVFKKKRLAENIAYKLTHMNLYCIDADKLIQIAKIVGIMEAE